MRHHWRLTLTATTMLGLGIGAALTMAGIVEHVLLRPLPVRDQDRILVSWGVFQSSGFGHVPVTHATIRAVAERTRVFERLAAFEGNVCRADQQRGLYQSARTNAEEVMRDAMKMADSRGLVASAVVKAATAVTPRPRYTAGRMARQVSLPSAVRARVGV